MWMAQPAHQRLAIRRLRTHAVDRVLVQRDRARVAHLRPGARIERRLRRLMVWTIRIRDRKRKNEYQQRTSDELHVMSPGRHGDTEYERSAAAIAGGSNLVATSRLRTDSHSVVHISRTRAIVRIARRRTSAGSGVQDHLSIRNHGRLHIAHGDSSTLCLGLRPRTKPTGHVLPQALHRVSRYFTKARPGSICFNAEGERVRTSCRGIAADVHDQRDAVSRLLLGVRDLVSTRETCALHTTAELKARTRAKADSRSGPTRRRCLA
jgi:hypothetical protein